MENNLERALIFAAVIVVALIAGCTVTNVHTRAKAAVEMQKSGADPLDIPCAIVDGAERYCELRAATRGIASATK